MLSNLETEVANQLGREHFEPYFDRLRGIGQVAHQQVSYETVLTRLSRINRTFVDCYQAFVEDHDVTVVITLDTIEAIRSMYLLLTLTQWMKELPRTLFILSGRPPTPGEPDPLRDELSDHHRPLQPVEMHAERVRRGRRPAASSTRAICTSRCRPPSRSGSSSSPTASRSGSPWRWSTSGSTTCRRR